MTCQQLTTVCIFMTTCQIASGQSGFSSLRFSLPQFLTNRRGLRALPQPPPGYHYEPMDYVFKNYPRNSFSIRSGASNIFNRNNNGGSAGGKIKNKRSRKPNNDEDGLNDNTLDNPSQATGTPSDGTSPDGSVPIDTPTDADPTLNGGKSAP